MNFDEERGAFGQTLRGSLGMERRGGGSRHRSGIPDREDWSVDSKKRWKSGGRWFSSFRAFYSFSFIFIQRYRNIVVYFMHVYTFLKLSIIFNRRLYEGTIIFSDAKKVISIELRSFERKALNGRMLIFFFFFLYQRINFSRESIAARVSCVANCYCIKVRMKQKFGYYLCLWTRD